MGKWYVHISLPDEQGHEHHGLLGSNLQDMLNLTQRSKNISKTALKCSPVVCPHGLVLPWYHNPGTKPSQLLWVKTMSSCQHSRETWREEKNK